MQITAGFAKGMNIKTPKGFVTRPTSARVREAFYNIIGNSLPGDQILDLFAGSGVMSFEALSRGAALAWMVDMGKDAAKIMGANSLEFDRRAVDEASSETKIIQKDVEVFLKTENPEPFDIVFADPPYADSAKWSKVFASHVDKWIKANGVFCIETDARGQKDYVDAFTGGKLTLFKEKTYGDTILLFFER